MTKPGILAWSSMLGPKLLSEYYTEEMLMWAHYVYLYDHNDTEPLTLAFCGAEVVPLPAKNLLFDIMQGKRKPKKKRAVQITYDPTHAWFTGLSIIGIRRAHDWARKDAVATATDLGIEPNEVIAHLAGAMKIYTKVDKEHLGIGDRTLQKIVADIEARLEKLPNL